MLKQRNKRGMEEKKRTFEAMLRERKERFLKDQRVLDNFFRDRLKYNHPKIINPQKFQQQRKDSFQNSPKFFSQRKPDFLQQSSDHSFQAIYQQPRIEDISRQSILRQKAQSFIQRLRKQKEYNKGKFLLLRRKEEERKEEQRIKLEKIKKSQFQSLNRKKREHIMNNILLHEKRISFRADESSVRSIRKVNIRSKTQNSDRSQSVGISIQVNRQEMPKINLPKRNMNASQVINIQTP